MTRVVTAAQASARDAAAIAAGIPSWQLMQAAGKRAADEILRRHGHSLGGVLVFAGPGNNGGDGWVAGRSLAERGISVVMAQIGERRTADSRRAAEAFREYAPLGSQPRPAPPFVVMDALLGTGAKGAPRGDIAEAIADIERFRSEGVPIIALDIPSGLDASTGAAEHAVMADLTITFGTLKRGLLINRGRSGAIVAVDIGLGQHAELSDGAPSLVDERWVASRVPPIPAESHKGIRRRVAIVGGARGMAGAVTLAARAAFRSGVGMVRLIVDDESLAAVQSGAVEATAASWPSDDESLRAQLEGFAHAVLLGPGLGRSPRSQALAERVLRVWRGPVVIDADALTLFAGELSRLRELLGERPAVLTPHASEFARLAGISLDEVLAKRFEAPAEMARNTGAVVLLKGVPTIIAGPTGDQIVTATGTPVLATAGSGDVLGGIIVTLLAQSGDALSAAGCGAWMHGRAAEIANAGRTVRGVTLEDVMEAIGHAWRLDATTPAPPVLVELPAVGDRPATGVTVA